ncbi:phospholipid-transporting ATPase ID-like isoform X2 [Hippocampus zosterae]|uniref:phospholipid-transporting ATPase ID-like isoform X2 n=1 Tax=Hippocampus zosterae TaxID=109293 RepID=UPI00223D2BD4|nr:phospholipid-transporting ATPase ID-like isoform X2 [Hippocampus zosterae]
MSSFGLHCARKKEPELERKLRANDRQYNLSFKYATNAIKTSKYNFFTFLPLNLFEQFQRIANAYFLFLLVLQVIPEISSLSWFTTVVPLALVLSVTAAKDATDDINRHRSDNHVNNRKVQVLIDGKLRSEKWMDVQVGDIIKLENNQFVTADLLLLSSSEPLNLVYIETAELDGETNLKVRQALPATGDLGDDVSKLAGFNGEVLCEAPNNRLDRFAGTLAYAGQKYALDNEKILLRGCTLRNTEWCFGLVLFGGPETKLMQNCGKSTFKRTSVDRLMNVLVLCIFGFLALMCSILAMGNYCWELGEGSAFTLFLPRQNGHRAAFSSFLTFWSYVIILNTVVPISLYVSVEFIRLGNSFYIDWDRDMYHSRSDTPAQARTTTLNEELGQIKYVFSDKTGTLTQNIMTFNKCSINGKTYGDVLDRTGQRLEVNAHTETVDFSFNPLADPRFTFHDHALVEAVKLEIPEVHAFFRLLTLCHTVMAEEKKEGQLSYQAQSPDEGALVTAARNFGFVFRSRTPDSVSVVEMGRQRTYRLLAILDFNNVRKRMSVIVRSPEGKLSLYCKGADTIIYERLHRSCGKLMDVTTEHLNEFAGEGLRTLALAYKDLDEDFFLGWQRRHHEASVAPHHREAKLEQLYEEIESDLLLLGATAIEDKLQDGVPQTIEQLSKADIKIWVLTGDKQETAENIGYSCNLLSEEMNDVFVIGGNSPEDVRRELRNARECMKPGAAEDCAFLPATTLGKSARAIADEAVNGDFGLVINGHSLTVYDELFITLYNLVYTALPVLGMSLFDQDVNDAWSFQHPRLYVPGQLNLYFSKMAFFKCALHSCYSSLVLFFIPYAAVAQAARADGRDLADHQSFAVLTQTCLLFAVTLQLGLEMSYWTAVNGLFVVGSLLMYFVVTFTMYSNGLFLVLPSAFPFIGTARNTLSQPNVWLTIGLTSILCILPVVTYRFLLILLRPTINDKVMFKARQAKASPPPLPRRTRIRRTSSRRSGYAFSHAQGYGDLVTSGRFLRRPAQPRPSALAHAGRAASAFSPLGRSAGYSPTGRAQYVKAREVEVTSLQMYRTVGDDAREPPR